MCGTYRHFWRLFPSDRQTGNHAQERPRSNGSRLSDTRTRLINDPAGSKLRRGKSSGGSSRRDVPIRRLRAEVSAAMRHGDLQRSGVRQLFELHPANDNPKVILSRGSNSGGKSSHLLKKVSYPEVAIRMTCPRARFHDTRAKGLYRCTGSRSSARG